MSPPRHRQWRSIAWLALGYVVAAVPVLWLVPQGQSAPMWPAAGIAVGALLVWGRGLWPGVWLGAFAASLLNAVAGGEHALITSAGLAAIVASGAALQASVGARLVQRYAAPGATFTHVGAVARFLLLAGPLACLISAGVGATALLAAGVLGPEAGALKWVTWWAGDTVGVLVVAPLVLAVGRRRAKRHWRAADLAVPLLVTGALIAVAHLWLDRYQRLAASQAVEREMDEAFDVAGQGLPRDLEDLRLVERFIAASDHVTAAEFEQFTRPLWSKPGLHLVEWAPHVPPGGRAEFETAQARLTGRDDFRIWDLQVELPATEAPDRGEFGSFPVALAAPTELGRARLGLNHASDRLRVSAIEQARDRGDPTGSTVSVFLETGRPALFVFVPAYRARPATSVPARRQALRGFVVGVYDIDDLVAPFAREAQRRHLDFRIHDVTPGEAPRHLAGDASGTWDSALGGSREVDFAGRRWLIAFRPAGLEPSQLAVGSLPSRMLLGASVLAAFLVALSALAAADHTASVSLEVGARTRQLRRELAARHAAETAARLSEQSLAITLDSIGDAVLVTDTQRRITRLNGVAEQLTGWSPADALGRPVHEVFRIINEETRAPAVIPVDEVLATGVVQNLANHTALIARDGSERSIADSAAPIRGADGSIVGVVLVFRDVSEERTATRALEESEARYRRLIEITPVGVFIQAEGRFAFANPMALSMLGVRSPADLLGRQVLEFLHPDSRQAVAARIRLLNEDRMGVPPLRERWLRADGTVMEGEAVAVPFEYQGRPAALVLLQDITARLTAERQRDQFFDMSLDLFAIAGKDGYLKRVNSTFTDVLGYSADELLSKPFIELVHPDDRQATVEEYQRIVGGKGSATFENRYQHKDGSWVWLSWHHAHSSTEKDVYYASARDVTESRRYEASLQEMNARLDEARRAAEIASRAKSDFLAVMSHEIRTPMNGVIGMLDVLRQTSLPGHQAEMVDLIRESAESLLSIIDDILDFSKIEAGKLDLETAPVHIDEVVQHIGGMFDHVATKKGVELALFADPRLPLVLGDAMRLRQVLMNLLSNAIKFSSGQERPGRVSLRAVLCDRADSCARVEFIVADNGVGMDEKTLSVLFSPFAQGDVSTTRRFGGTGLGLTISRHLVEMMGGEIKVDSAVAEGSTFRVLLTLPFVDQEPAGPGTGSASLNGLTCVVVSDEKATAEDLVAYLRHAGATANCVELTQATECAHRPAPQPIVWVILDDSAGHAEATSIARLRRAGAAGTFVLVCRGRRRRPRKAGPDVVVIDRNGLIGRNFVDAVAVAAGRKEAEQTIICRGMDQLSGTRSSRLAPPSNGRLLLVAEDNEINQKVIEHQLGMLGYRADVVGDGRQALEHWESGRYALLLTDLHMPDMDGYDLARAIRLGEGGGSRMPIVALTANAVRSEAEHCRAAGMDDCLSKPASLDQLRAMLDKWIPQPATPAAESGADPGAPCPDDAPPVVDLKALHGLVGTDEAVVRPLLERFRTSAAEIGREIGEACEAGQARRAALAAHKLKSAAETIGAHELGALCAELERAGKDGTDPGWRELAQSVGAGIAQVDRFLATRLEMREGEPGGHG